MENRHGLAVDGCLTPANGYGERAAALDMVGRGDDPAGHPGGGQRLRQSRLRRSPALAPGNPPRRAEHLEPFERDRSTHHAPRWLRVSQQKRKRIEEVFGWLKDHRADAANALPRPAARRLDVRLFSLAVYNLVRIRNLAECPA